MSAPITVNVARSASVASSSPSSPGLYVPIHKRTSSSSRPSSPSSTSSSDTSSPYMYSAATLLSLQPLADESMKGKIRINCPEVVMSRKMRKGLDFNGRRTEISRAQRPLTQAPTLIVDTSAKDTNAIQTTLQTPPPAPLRVLPRRSRPAGRAPERRRNVLGSTFGTRRTGDDSWRLQTVPMSTVVLV